MVDSILGHVIFDKEMRAVFYSPQLISPRLTLKSGFHKSRKIELVVKPDPDWKEYIENMLPAPIERERSRSRELLKMLRDSGDDHSKPRTVDFAALFTNENSRIKFLSAAEERGFERSKSIEPLWTDDDGRFWCELTRVLPLNTDEIFKCTAFLREQAQLNEGEFDGWACTVNE